MKRLTYLIAFFALGALLTFASCGEDEKPKSAEETQLEKLAGAWNVSDVTLDGTVTSDFDDMVLTLTSSKGYSTSGGDFDPVWASSGTFDFKANTDGQTIIRDDAVEIVISNLSGTNMTMSFEYQDAGIGCRSKGICGNYVFNFEK